MGWAARSTFWRDSQHLHQSKSWRPSQPGFIHPTVDSCSDKLGHKPVPSVLTTPGQALAHQRSRQNSHFGGLSNSLASARGGTPLRAFTAISILVGWIEQECKIPMGPKKGQECYQNLALAASADNGKPQTPLRNLPLTGEGGGIVAIKSGARFRKPGLSDEDRSFTPPVPHGW